MADIIPKQHIEAALVLDKADLPYPEAAERRAALENIGTVALHEMRMVCDAYDGIPIETDTQKCELQMGMPKRPDALVYACDKVACPNMGTPRLAAELARLAVDRKRKR